MIEFFYILAILQIAAGLYLTFEGLRWNSYVRRQMMSHGGFYAPRTAVLCPCKGVEPGLELNLRALCGFDYANYEVFFIIASESDPAHEVLQRTAAASKGKAHVVVAGAPHACGEKVNNLRTAMEQLPGEFDVVAFADSDGRPNRRWLTRLVAPLADPRLGAATTMRWYIPERKTFASALLAAWNAPIVTLLGEHGRNFCWGGGTAIRRSVFEQIGMFDEWRGSVSDDLSMTRALRRAGRRIQFVPQCLTPTFADAELGNVLEFTNRQILITRVYAPEIWWPAAVTHLMFCLTILLGLGLFVANAILDRSAFHLAVLTFLPVILAAVRAGIRISGAGEALAEQKARILDGGLIATLLGTFISFLYAYNFVHSLTTRRITWRGLCYELVSPSDTKILPG